MSSHTLEFNSNFLPWLPRSMTHLALPFSLLSAHLPLSVLCSYQSLVHLLLLCCTKLIPASEILYMLSFLLGILLCDLSMTHSFTSLNTLLNYSLFKETFLDYSLSNSQPSVTLYPLSLFYFSLWPFESVVCSYTFSLVVYCLSMNFMRVLLCFMFHCTPVTQNKVWYMVGMQVSVEYVSLLEKIELVQSAFLCKLEGKNPICCIV